MKAGCPEFAAIEVKVHQTCKQSSTMSRFDLARRTQTSCSGANAMINMNGQTYTRQTGAGSMFSSFRSTAFWLRGSLRLLSGGSHFPIRDRHAGPCVRDHHFRDSVSLQAGRWCLAQSVFRVALGALLLLPLVAALLLFCAAAIYADKVGQKR
jgi:hypothetical protein